MLEPSRGNDINWCSQCSYYSEHEFQMNHHFHRAHRNVHIKMFNAVAQPELYMCGFCTFTSDCKLELHEHLKQRQGELCLFTRRFFEWYKCEQCSFPTRSSLQQVAHSCRIEKPKKSINLYTIDLTKDVSQEEKWFSCGECSFRTTTGRILKEHVQKHAEYECKDCSFRAKHLSILDRHIVMKHVRDDEVGSFECAKCPFKTKFFYSFRKHLLNKHDKANCFNCTKCSFKTKYFYSFRKHLSTQHDEAKWFNCSKCSYKTKKETAYDRHMSTKHRMFHCSKCSCTSNRKDWFDKHTCPIKKNT